MMLLKRLLLPGKGDLIICILILLNVLLWCGESEFEISTFSASTNYVAPSVITTLLLLSSSYSSYSCWCKNYGVALVTYNYLISLQFHRVYAATEEVLDVSKALTQQPVFKKTDPLSMTLALNKAEEGGANVTTQHNGHNYNRKRRRPVYHNSSSYSSNRSVGVLSSNSSNFLNNNGLVNKSDVHNVLLKSDGGSGNSSRSNATVLSNSVNLLTLSSNETSDNSNLKMSSSTSGNSTLSLSSIVHLKRRNKGKTRNATTVATSNSNVSLNKDQSESGSGKKKRKPKLLKELTMFNRQNCLAKLLCGVQVAVPPTKSSSALNDYAYLVKAFFDRFSIRGIVTDVIDTAFAYEQDGLELLDDEVEDEDHDHDTTDDDDDDDDTSSERRKKNSRVKIGNTIIGGAGIHKPKTPQFEKYKPKYYERYDKDVYDVELEELVDDDVPDFMQPDVLRRRHGKTLLKRFNQTEQGKSATIGAKRVKRRIAPVDINRVRRRRGIVGEVKRGFMGFFNPRFDKSAYLDKRQLDLESTKNEARQLNIAEEIAKRLRSPRQCRLLNWFGNNGNSNTNTATSSNGMTTTITTITNTGGMVGNLERLGSVQPGLPQSAVNGNGGGIGTPGSQVVTVIQQSPLGSAASTSAPVATSKATNMLNNLNNNLNKLNNMGQSASNAMAQASEVASQIGSTICPFNIQELQDLIIKAQVAPFPHFLTTTPPSPTRITPAEIFPQSELPYAQSTSTSTTSTTASTSLKSTKQPPSPSTTGVDQSPGQTRHGLDSPFFQGYNEFTDPHPTPPRYRHPTSPNLYHDDVLTLPTRYHIRNPTTPSSPYRIHDRHNNPKLPSRYHIRHTTPTYPSPTYSSEYLEQFEQQTRQPSIIPPMGIAGDDNVDDFFEDEPYDLTYQKNKVASPFERHKVHHTVRKKKPLPKWMTTTTLSPDDEFYGYSDAIPNYSYGTQQQGSYKLSNQQQQVHKPLQHHQAYKEPQHSNHGQNGYKHRPRPPTKNNYHPNHDEHEEEEQAHFKVRPDFPKEPTAATTPNYLREFHHPPVVVDSNTRYPAVVGPRQTSPQKPIGPIGGKPPARNPGQNQNRPQQNKKSEEDEDSGEDESSSSDNSGDEDDESEENGSSSGEGESRTNLPSNSKQRMPSSRPATPTVPLQSPPEGGSVEGSDENDDEEGSNEAQEKKEKGAENEEEDEEGSEEEDGENDGKRSYERNDFSKDRGGPTSSLSSTTTERPNNKNVKSNGETSNSNGFLSTFFRSIPSFRSLFTGKKGKSDAVNNNNNNNNVAYPKPLPHPPRPPPLVSPNSFSTKIPSNQQISNENESEELDEEQNDETDDDDNDETEDEEEDSEEVKVKEKQKVTKPPKQKVVVQPKKKINLQIKTKIPINPWVNDNTRIQVSLKTTPVPVVIEDSSSWSRPFWENEEDDSGEDYLRENPVENQNEAVKNKNKTKPELTKKQKDNNDKLFSGLGISPDLSEFLSDLHRDHSSKKKDSDGKTKIKVGQKPPSHEDDEDEDDDLSNESDEDTRLPPPFMSREPID